MSIEPVAWIIPRKGEAIHNAIANDDLMKKQPKHVQDDWLAHGKPCVLKSDYDELQRQLAEHEAVIERLREALEYYTMGGSNYTKMAKEALAIPTDHTALDEAIKQAKVEVLEEAAEWFDDKCFADIKEDMFAEDKLRRMADEIRSKT